MYYVRSTCFITCHLERQYHAKTLFLSLTLACRVLEDVSIFWDPFFYLLQKIWDHFFMRDLAHLTRQVL